MTRSDKADFRTICNRRVRSTFALTEKASDVISSPFPQRRRTTKGRPLPFACQRYGGRCRASPIFQRSPAIKEGNTGSCFVRPQEDMDFNVHYAKGVTRNSTELDEEAIGAPKHQGLPQMDVEGNITLLISESKASLWHIQLLWTPPARHVNRKGKRLACEKHMDWWPASTKPI